MAVHRVARPRGEPGGAARRAVSVRWRARFTPDGATDAVSGRRWRENTLVVVTRDEAESVWRRAGCCQSVGGAAGAPWCRRTMGGRTLKGVAHAGWKTEVQSSRIQSRDQHTTRRHLQWDTSSIL